jgi:hypothetical protein
MIIVMMVKTYNFSYILFDALLSGVIEEDRFGGALARGMDGAIIRGGGAAYKK